MKKIIGLIIISALIIASAIGLTACNYSGGDTVDGLKLTKYTGDDYYTVTGYVAKDGETTLDIAAALPSGITVGRIKANSFNGNNTVKNLIVPDTVVAPR